MQTDFVKKDALYKVHTILTQSLFLKNYIMLISQFRSRFYLRKVIMIIFVCMCVYMSVHVCTYYVFVCMCICLEQWHLNVSCMSLIYEILKFWVPKMFYSQMYIKFICKTIQLQLQLQLLTCYISNLKSIGTVVVELQASKATL